MAGAYGLRRRGDAGQKAPPKVFAREDADGVKKKRDRPEDDGGADGDGEGRKKKKKSKEDKKRDKREKKERKKALAALVLGTRGGAPKETPSRDAPPDPPRVPTSTEGDGGKKAKRKKEKEGKVSKRKDKSTEPDKAGKKKGIKKKSGKGEKDAATGGANDKKGTKAKKPTARSMAARKYYEQVKVDGEVFNRGDCAYVIGDKTRDLDDDELEPCGACGECGDEDDVMLECDACLRGWHMRCLHPPLDEVPEGEWYCPKCLSSATGVAAPAENGRRMAHTEFLAGNLHLCRIECIWQEANGKFMFVGRWFATPEETHTGRQAHHSRREVFLTNNTDENCVDSLLRKAAVLLPQQYRDATRLANDAAANARRKAREAKAAKEGGAEPASGEEPAPKERVDEPAEKESNMDLALNKDPALDKDPALNKDPALAAAEAAGDDVFLCEYTYDQHFHRFKRRTEWDDDDLSDDDLPGGVNFYHGGLTLADEDDEDEDLDAEDSDADLEEWGGSKRSSKRPSSKKGARGKGKIGAVGVPLGGRARGRVISRHIAASRREAAAAGDYGGVLGLGAVAVPRMDKPVPTTALGRARQALSLAHSPGTLPCRDNERKKIVDFVEQSINAGAQCLGRCLYISGVPGTGKTATVREVVRTLRKKSRDGSLPRFNHVELNGLRLQTPKHAYSAIAEELMGERLSPQAANDVLDRRFKEGRGSDGRVTVLVIDEMDLLVTRTQQLLYNLFDWPTHRAARLVILGIANTLDLPERLLPKILSRLGSNRVSFQPYSADQLMQIVKGRLQNTGGPGLTNSPFEDTAVQLASRKVAAVSGDARRVLELCRRGAELAEARVRKQEKELEREKEGKENMLSGQGAMPSTFFGTAATSAARPEKKRPNGVDIKDIQAAQREMFQTPHMHLLEAASRHERIFLAALVMELRRTGLSDACITNVMRAHEQLCRQFDEPLPPAGAAAAIACRLASIRLLLADPGRKRSAQRVSLNVPRDDVVYALKQRENNAAKAAAAAMKEKGLKTSAVSKEEFAEFDHGDIPWLRNHPGLG
jgi:origin recognition complex subunit 1